MRCSLGGREMLTTGDPHGTSGRGFGHTRHVFQSFRPRRVTGLKTPCGIALIKDFVTPEPGESRRGAAAPEITGEWGLARIWWRRV